MVSFTVYTNLIRPFGILYCTHLALQMWGSYSTWHRKVIGVGLVVCEVCVFWMRRCVYLIFRVHDNRESFFWKLQLTTLAAHIYPPWNTYSYSCVYNSWYRLYQWHTDIRGWWILLFSPPHLLILRTGDCCNYSWSFDQFEHTVSLVSISLQFLCPKFVVVSLICTWQNNFVVKGW